MNGPSKKPTAKERLARNLRDWRVKRGMSQEVLSASAGLSQTFLSQVESGMRNVSVDNVEKLAEVLEVDIQELFCP